MAAFPRAACRGFCQVEGDDMVEKRGDFKDIMALLSVSSFIIGGTMLWVTGEDPGSVIQSGFEYSQEFVAANFENSGITNADNLFETIKNNLLELALTGGAALSGTLTFLWRRIRIMGLSLIATISGHGSSTLVDLNWADSVSTVAHAGMLLWMISAVTAAFGVLAIFRKGRPSPKPVEVLRAVNNARRA